MLIGQVTRMQSGFYNVHTPDGAVTCQLRKRVKRTLTSADYLAVGDWVKILVQPDGSGQIEEILPRRSSLVRLAPTPRGPVQQVLLANPDHVVLVFACANPSPHLRMLDRFLVICEKQELPPLIVANKIDLVSEEAARQVFSPYENIGYAVLYTSARLGVGVDALRQTLAGKLSAFSGPSGVGKSSLLNAVQPKLGLAVSETSAFTSKGRHTTVVRELFPLDGGGFVIDMPGLRSLALWDIEPEELDGYFPEIRPLVEKCQFNNCSHSTEPGCAVRSAVEAGAVSPQRYDSYLRLRAGQD
jgi:ribosome biogenesis GTPase / thiamine phosphate phosphatase